MKRKFRIHPYQFYVPPWCNHPIFESISYCWGLALAVDKGKLDFFFKNKCDMCDDSDFFNEDEFNKTIAEMDNK